MDNDQSRASNSSRESGSEFANSVAGSTRASAAESISGGKDSISDKDSITHSIAESEPAEAPMETTSEAPMETTSEARMETTPEEISSVCATQACAQPTDIVKLAEATLQNLKVLWDEIGFAEHECDNATAEMFAEVKRVFENKLSTTQEVKCQLTSQIRLANARICTIGTELGESASVEAFKSSEETSAPNLRAVLAASKAFLDDLEGRKGERTAALTARAEELSGLFLELDGALSAEQAKFLKVVSDLTLGRIEQFEARIREHQEEKQGRQGTVAGRVEEIRGLWAELQLATDKFDAGSVDARIQGGEEWKLTQAGMLELEERLAQLTEEKQRRVADRDAAAKELGELWAITKTSAEESAAFEDAHSDLSTHCMGEMRAEIGRLQAVKAAMMKQLVHERREALREVWETMRLSEEKRALFAAARAEHYSEALLEQHDAELAQCHEKLATMQPLLKIIDRRLFIRAEEAAMKESQADPSRLLGRGRGMAERLKQEEKIRNMVTKEMPKLNDKLKAGLADYKATYHEDFEVDGVVFEEVLREELEAAAAAKPRKAGTGKAGPPPASVGKGVPQTPREGRGDKEVEGTASKAEGTASKGGVALNKFRSAAKAISRVPMASLDTNSVAAEKEKATATGKRQAEGEAEKDGSSSARSNAKSPRHGTHHTAAPLRGTGTGHLKRTITPKQ